MPWTPDGQYIDDGTSSDNAGNDAYTGVETFNPPAINGIYDEPSDSYWPNNQTNSTQSNNNSNMLSSIFGGANGLKTAAATAGALAGATGLLDNKTKRSGYQGGIPQLQAVRNMVTAPPPRSTGYRPGQGGVNWNSDVYYAPKGAVPAGLTGTMTPAAVAAAQNLANATGKSSSSSLLSNLTKIAGGAGIASLLTSVLGNKTNLTGLVDKNGNLTPAGLKTVTDKLSSTAKTGTSGNNSAAAGAVTAATKGINTQSGTPSGSTEEATSSTTGEAQAADDGTTEGINEIINAPNDEAYDLNENDNALDVNVDGSDEIDTSILDGIDTSSLDNLGLTEEDLGGYDLGGDYSNFDFGNDDNFNFGLEDLEFARGGAINMAHGRYLQGNTDGMADKIPAKIGEDQPAALSHGEFVVPADVVSHLGNGNSDAGAKKLYQMMDKIRVARTGNKKQGKQINPDKFMPGGLAQAYASGGKVMKFSGTDGSAVPGITGATAAANAGITGSEQAPNTWAGEYMSNLLGKTQALTESPYQQYMGPLTAGASDLQNKMFTGLQNTAFPSNLGQTFSSQGAYPAPQAAALGSTNTGGITGANATPAPQGIASQYMNPYLQNVLDPQLAELRRQNDITNMATNAKLTGAGAFGGSRQAIMNAENNRNLMQEMNKTVGTGYANAFDKAQQQFNTEQTQGRSLADLIAQQGAAQRGIEAEGIAADKASFEEARQNPYNMLQFQQSMLNGMPISASSYDLAQPSTLTKAAQGATTVNQLLKNLGLSQNTP